MNLALFLLASAGATSIITRSYLFKPFRSWLDCKFIHCPQCVGFWVGAASSDFYPWQVLSWFHYACAASLVSFILVQLVGDDGLRIDRGQSLKRIFKR